MKNEAKRKERNGRKEGERASKKEKVCVNNI